MRKSQFWIAYFLLLVAQLLLSNFANFTPYLTLTLLPVMVLCISIRINDVTAMLIAFATGLAVDWLGEGLLGLNALALVPVAYARTPVLRAIFGAELFARKEDFTVQRHGIERVVLALFIVQALFLILYIWADGAGTRPFWFNAVRFIASMAGSLVLSVLALRPLASSHG